MILSAQTCLARSRDLGCLSARSGYRASRSVEVGWFAGFDQGLERGESPDAYAVGVDAHDRFHHAAEHSAFDDYLGVGCEQCELGVGGGVTVHVLRASLTSGIPEPSRVRHTSSVGVLMQTDMVRFNMIKGYRTEATADVAARWGVNRARRVVR